MNNPLGDIPSPPDPSPEEIINNFARLTSDPKARAKLKHSLIHNKPTHWSHKSCAPYYRESYANLVRIVLDRMVATGRDQIYYYKDFPSDKPTTLYSKFVQGKNFLLEHMDEDGKYNTLCECLSVTRKRGIGIVVSLRKDILELEKAKGNLSQFLPKELVTDASEWRERMEQWIDYGSSDVPFIVENIALSQEDIDQLKIELNDLPNIASQITERSIKLVKI